MCGLTGFWGQTERPADEIIGQMVSKLVHRGPDDEGMWLDRQTGIALGHRRLSIVDLSPQGHQPMLSSPERYVIAFNGEIYNFNRLRQELDQQGVSPSWRGRSDTEVMLAAISHWGILEAVKRFTGMFAFALWDRSEKTLYLVRDRLGEKPLYYGWAGGVLLFGSELKALKAHPAWKGKINRNSLALLMRYNYIPAPHSIYEGIFKLLPGTMLVLTPKNLEQRALPDVRPYWSARKMAEEGTAHPFTGNSGEAVKKLDTLLREAVAGQMVADVPLGAFLSGGVDSSTVVALMQAQSSRPVKTFTIGFKESDFNEAKHARAVARHLKTDHIEFYVTPQEAMGVIPRMGTLYDEPFADSSQIPTFLVSQLAKQHVTVALSGDGGDELFGGYNRYFLCRKVWKNAGWIPGGIRKGLAGGLTFLSPRSWDLIFRKLKYLLPEEMKQAQAGDKLHKLAGILGVNSPEEMYLALVSHWKSPGSVVLGSVEPLTVANDRSRWADLPDFTQRMMYQDLVSYLPDDILVKLDRASMGVSLESRVPFLDHRVVEFSFQIPLSMKIQWNKGKWLLRKVLDQYVPGTLIERPKMGFGVPIDAWLRGSLKEWAESLLSERRLKEEGYFDPGPVREKWNEHLSGVRNWQYHLWDVLMFQAWLEAQ